MPITELSKHSGWFDSHCHLNEVNHLSRSLTDAAQHQIESFVIPGTRVQQWAETLPLQSNHIHIALGTHPWFVSDPEQEVSTLRTWLNTHNAVAVGEIGLDYYQGKHPRPEQYLQLEAFEGQLVIAKEYDLPVIIHSVKAHNDVIRILKRMGICKGVVHAFTGSTEIAQSYVDQGLHLGVGPMILKSPKTLNAVSDMPIEKLLLETDSPFMATESTELFNPLLDLIQVAEKLAEYKLMPVSEIQEQTRLNSCRFFGLD